MNGKKLKSYESVTYCDDIEIERLRSRATVRYMAAISCIVQVWHLDVDNAQWRFDAALLTSIWLCSVKEELSKPCRNTVLENRLAHPQMAFMPPASIVRRNQDTALFAECEEA
jgi:hypothetical protein